MAKKKNGLDSETREKNRAFSRWLLKLQDDYLWFLNQLDLRLRYAGKIVVLHDRVVLGSGETGEEARDAARQWCESHGQEMPPEKDLLIFVSPVQIFVQEWSDPRPTPPTPGES